MCGILGIHRFDGRPVRPADLRAMSQVCAHRGPDDEGYVLVHRASGAFRAYAGADSPPEIRTELPLLGHEADPAAADVGLGHRRFSIIDLSPAGHQPFFSTDGRSCVVFNGEIYNYLELREELERAGRRFRTHSDTEVLLEAYAHWGTDAFARLNGFWALALYDFAERRLLLSRDRFGKRPLFWTQVGGAVYFASEIKALLRVPEVSDRRAVDEAAAYRWLAYGRKDLDDSTLYAGIRSLPAGTWCRVDEGFPAGAQRFWAPPTERLTERDIGVDEAAARLRETLTESVRLRLRADVPVGAELSGGMDSSAVVALASLVLDRPLTTFTVRFPEAEWNEEGYARAIGERYRTDYRVLDSPADRFWDDILAFTYLQEEPYHSPNLHTNQLIWARMRELGIKVSLNGAAGDEILAGYGHHFDLAQAENLLHGRLGAWAANARGRVGGGAVGAMAGPLRKLARAAMQPVLPSMIARRQRPTWVRALETRGNPVESGTLSGVLLSDLTNTLIPYWLRSGDRGYMGVPLEVRAPFLDFRVSDLAFRLPTTYLVRDGWQKWILRKAMADLLPEEVLWRRQKLGFPFPVERFFQESAPIVETIWREARNPYLDLSRPERFGHDWKVLSFVLWYELFFNDNVDLFRRLETMAGKGSAAGGFQPAYLTSCGMLAG